jgi:DNA-binding response OmpR family regulator
MHITIAGEEPKFCAQLQELLEAHNHQITSITRHGHVIEALRQAPPHLLVIVESFFKETLGSFLHVVREDPKLRRIPILCVNPKGSGSEGVDYLQAGADDFINRPFNPQIFVARVRTLLRRAIWSGDMKEEEEVTVLRAKGLEVKLVSRQALAAGVTITLTRLEFDLLSFLMKSPERVFKRQEILDAVWNYPQSVETRTLDKHVETLRKKLGAPGESIQTVHGIGYRFAGSGAAARKA